MWRLPAALRCQGPERLTHGAPLGGGGKGPSPGQQLEEDHAQGVDVRPRVQIEQSPRARSSHWQDIADAVANVYSAKL